MVFRDDRAKTGLLVCALVLLDRPAPFCKSSSARTLERPRIPSGKTQQDLCKEFMVVIHVIFYACLSTTHRLGFHILVLAAAHDSRGPDMVAGSLSENGNRGL
ncbi:hypothetical protein PsYK624_167920 [Phanerochaete sordida]|uniref:Uncharacterized protein n=1 Tax=Phanerochaete sordida TaxID=48140 RepID=A0A9P3GRG2_9APHY|nr:hypothetical protein PsYK624_167920 [Phanerochaete sordida]